MKSTNRLIVFNSITKTASATVKLDRELVQNETLVGLQKEIEAENEKKK